MRCIVDADRMKGQIQENCNRIKAEVKQIVADELKCIADDPAEQTKVVGDMLRRKNKK